MTTLHLVRHGRSTRNEAGLLQGQAPGPELTALGHEQARTAARALAGLGADALYSSDQPRARQTAEHVAAATGLAVHPCPRLRERGYGTLEGHPSAEAARLAGDIDWLDPDVRPGGGESLRDVHARVQAVLDACRERHPDGTVILVSHGDTIRVAAAAAAGLGPHEVPWLEVANGSVTVLTLSR